MIFVGTSENGRNRGSEELNCNRGAEQEPGV